MHGEAVRRFIHRYIEEVWHKRNLDAGEREFWHPHIRNAYMPEYPSGVDGMKKLILPLFGAFNELHVEVEDLLIDVDMVAARLKITMRHTGPFGGIPPTGKQAALNVALWQRIVDGKLGEYWPIADWSTLYDQLRDDADSTQ